MSSNSSESRTGRISSIGESIRGFIKRAGLERPFLEHQALSLWTTAVEGRLGAAAAAAAPAETVRNGELVVRVTGDGLRQRLSFEKSQLLDVVNASAGSRVVTSIRLV